MLPLVLLVAVAIAISIVSSRSWQSGTASGDAWGRARDRVRKMEAIAEYHRSRTDAASEPTSLDDRTWNDLDLDKVFAVLDHTESTLGQQALYHRLRTSPVADHVDAFESLVVRMTDDVDARARVRKALSRLQDPAGYDLWWLAQPGAIERQAWHVLFPTAAVGVVVALLLTPVWPGALFMVVVFGVVNMIVRGATAGRIRAVLGSFRQIGPLIRTAEDCRFLLREDVEPIAACLGEELDGLRRLKLVAGWASREPSAGNDVAGAFLEYLNQFLLLDVNAVYFGAGELNARGASLLRVIAAVGEIDAALAVASYRHGTPGWSRPRLRTGSGPAVFTNIRHPLLEDAVPNSLELGPPHGVLITGSNMSGKSTFIRTLGVNAILAQTINTCLAGDYEAPVFRVRTCIGRSDDLSAGKSYYLAEVESVLALLNASASDAPHLFLFDELFRGTNAVERIAAAEAVLNELVIDDGHLRPHMVIAATHDAELVELLSGLYASYHFEDTLGPEGLSFEYRLKSGPATSRNAIELLRLHGASDGLVNRALDRAAALDRQRDRLLEQLPDRS